LITTNHRAPHCTTLSITTKPLDHYKPHSPSLYNSLHNHKTTWSLQTTEPLTVQLSPSPQNHLITTNHTARHCTTLSITTKPLHHYKPHSPSLYNYFQHHKTTLSLHKTQPLTVQLSPSPQNHLINTNHTVPHCTTLSITTKPLDHYKPHSPSLYNSLHHHKTTWSLQTTHPLTVQLSPVTYYFRTLLSFLRFLFSTPLKICFTLNVKKQGYLFIALTIVK
jgi:hypothetical protein